MRYGIYDTVDNLWIGNDTGPLGYDDRQLAEVSALTACVCAGWPVTRCRVRKLPCTRFKLRDSVTNKVTPAKAIELLEKGYT